MMTTESSSLVGRRSPALLAGFSFVANVRFTPGSGRSAKIGLNGR